MYMENRGCKAHVLVLPYPAQGHINPMLQFAKRLASKGIKATLVTTIHRSKSMHVDPKCSIAVETISDGYDELGPKTAESPEAYFENLRTKGSQSLANLIKKLDDMGQPVTALVYDGLFPWALDVAKKQFGRLGVVFFTQSCAVNNIYYHVHRGVLPLPLPGPDVSVPGLQVLLRPSETPCFVYKSESTPQAVQDFLFGQFSNVDEADLVLFSTFYKLEDKMVDWMSKLWKLGTIGPTVPSMYLDKRLEDDKDNGINIFKPETSACMNWLNDKPSGSVVYVSFGSTVEVTPEQMKEMAWGLKAINCYFLWVVRESEEAKLPSKYIEETSDRGLVVSWCSQLEVLAHESVGCFVTHCGLNSVLEALSLGIAMVAVPQMYDQPTNAKYVEDVWGAGIRALPDEDGVVRREVLENCIREVMEGEKGKKIKENVKKWKILAKEAMDGGGSSDNNIEEFVAKLLCSPSLSK